jgi:hypothetical protein
MDEMTKHTPTPWPEPEYDNDVGPMDEGFWEWWGAGKPPYPPSESTGS